MTAIEILEKIIEENGCCDWTAHVEGQTASSICLKCPLSYDIKGRHVACVELTGVNKKLMSSDEVRKAYIKVAQKILADLLAEEMLLGLKQR